MRRIAVLVYMSLLDLALQNSVLHWYERLPSFGLAEQYCLLDSCLIFVGLDRVDAGRGWQK